MPETYDDKWGEVNHQGRAILLGLLTISLFVLAAHLDKVALGLEHDMANGFRVSVTEPLNALVDDINNTGNLKEVTAIGLGLTAGLVAFWLGLSPQYWQKKSK